MCGRPASRASSCHAGAVWDAWLELLGDRRAWQHTGMTVYETMTGFAWATAIGVGLGVLIGRCALAGATLNPFIVATQVIPKVALVPLFVVWFGFGIDVQGDRRGHARLLSRSSPTPCSA